MSTQPQQVPLQPLGYGAYSLLGFHMGSTDYLLGTTPEQISAAGVQVYADSQAVWLDLIGRTLIPGIPVALMQVQIMDWFPRAPGLYYSENAEYARQGALQYLDPRFPSSPIRDHASRVEPRRGPDDYTVVFTPEGKLSMLEGGIGSIRLKPILLDNQPHWLLTATSDGITHKGIPIAMPHALYAKIFREITKKGSVMASITGEFQFVPSAFTHMFDYSTTIPKVVLKVTELRAEEQKQIELETSVAVSFVSEYQGRPSVYATYVTFRPDVQGSFEDAIRWMKGEYVEGMYKGRIITDFDQTRTIFPEAQLALNKVMARMVSRQDLTEVIELMHVSARIDEYFDEIAKRDLLPRSGADRTKIFISYAHAVERETGWVARIRTHLQGLGRGLDFETWDDTRIEPGTRWHDEIARAIRQSRVAVLVLTADFLNSEYIRASELPLLLEAADSDGARILCLYGSAVHLSGVAERLGRYQFVNAVSEPLDAMTNSRREQLFSGLCRMVESMFSS